MFYDLAITFDPASKRCDLSLSDDGDLAIDLTPIPAIIMAVGLDRRADIDDPLPEGRSHFLTPTTFSERRGAVGDGLDPFGEFTGSKMWLLDRAKHTEVTLQLAKYWLKDAMEWAERETGIPAHIEASWIRSGVLGYRIMVEDTSLALSKRID